MYLRRYQYIPYLTSRIRTFILYLRYLRIYLRNIHLLPGIVNQEPRSIRSIHREDLLSIFNPSALVLARCVFAHMSRGYLTVICTEVVSTII